MMSRGTIYLAVGTLTLMAAGAVIFLLEQREEEKQLEELKTFEDHEAAKFPGWPWPARRKPMRCHPIGMSAYYCRETD